MSGAGIICFASSYLIALCLEITRVFFRSAVRNAFVLFWIAAGLTAHTAYLYYHTAVFPVDSAKTYFLLSAWCLVLAVVCLSYFRSKTPFGIVLLPLALLLIGGAVLVPETSELVPQTELILQKEQHLRIQCRNFHTGTFLFATLALSIGFTAGVLYLIQDRRLRQKRPPFSLFHLPSLEWSLKICRYSVWTSLLFLGASIAAGVLLKTNYQIYKGSKQVSLFDPLILGTLLLFSFLLLFSGILSERLFRTEGKQIAFLTFFSFLFLLAVLLFAVLLNNSHWQWGVIQ